jgi:cytidyltransferase-like protein
VILAFDQLNQYRGLVAMVDGAFDPLHRGHIEYFKAACALGAPLLCNVASDDYVRTKHPPLLPEDQRTAIVDAIRYIAYTHLNQYDTETILRAAASLLRQRTRLARPAAAGTGRDLPGAWHRNRLSRYRARLVDSTTATLRCGAHDTCDEHH